MKKNLLLSFAAILSLAVVTPAKPGSATGYDLNYEGPYEVVTESLNCRYGPGTNFGIKNSLNYGTGVSAKYVVNDTQNSPWLFTDRGCFVRGYSTYLKYRGYGEDPSTMCDPRVEPC